MAARTANLPEPLIGARPGLFDEGDDLLLQATDVRARFATAGSADVDGVHDFAVDIELELLVGGVANAHGAAVFVALEPGQLHFRQEPVPGYAVHNLEVRRLPGDGAQEPVLPVLGLLRVSRNLERVEGEGGVAKPAVAVVPVADAADRFGERGRRRRHDSAGGGEVSALSTISERWTSSRHSPP